MEADASSAEGAVVPAFPSLPSTGSVNVSQTRRHQYSQNRTGIPLLLPIDLTGADPLHLNSPLSPNTPPITSIWANEAFITITIAPKFRLNLGRSMLELNQQIGRSLLRRPPRRLIVADGTP